MSAIDEQLAACGVGINHHFGGEVYAKETNIPAGIKLTQHSHEFDHLSILALGTVRVTVDGKGRTLNAPMCLNIPAGAAHEVEALTDAVWYCIWPEGLGV